MTCVAAGLVQVRDRTGMARVAGTMTSIYIVVRDTELPLRCILADRLTHQADPARSPQAAMN